VSAASGAYVPVDEGSGRIRLAGNPEYWAGEPPLRSITVLDDLGGRSPVEAFQDEVVDWTRIGPSDAPWLRYEWSLGPQLRRADDLAVDFLGFDTARPPFDDRHARRAVAMAVDWRRLALLADPQAAPATSLLPPGIAGRSDEDFRPSYDPATARRELAAAGYPGGAGFPVVTLSSYGVGQPTAVAEELERELGIEVAVETRPFGEHSAILDSDAPPMWTLSWSADYPHAHDFLGLLLRSGSSANAGHWSDPRFDALIDRAAATDDPAEQERLYTEAQRIVRDEVPVIPLAYGVSWWLSRDWLAGATPSGVGILRYATMDRVDR
jgi:oligopeptide transport system substrate-binding protein